MSDWERNVSPPMLTTLHFLAAASHSSSQDSPSKAYPSVASDTAISSGVSRDFR